MFGVEISSPNIFVKSKNHSYTYAVDGSLPNPLEATYAALAGCAGVYALKVCKKLAKSPEGIKITCRPVNRADNPLTLSKWTTVIEFPEGWSEEEQNLVLAEVQKCAVKELISTGSQIQFVTEKA
ncbi:OsmC family protein [Bdellovibrio sp.]|uniref:OsmC family protein n=1 Tax=Bdellovibrio sp. TaxID=28201 RepID=UPI0039E706DD